LKQKKSIIPPAAKSLSKNLAEGAATAFASKKKINPLTDTEDSAPSSDPFGVTAETPKKVVEAPVVKKELPKSQTKETNTTKSTASATSSVSQLFGDEPVGGIAIFGSSNPNKRKTISLFGDEEDESKQEQPKKNRNQT